jgi:S-formylglutathione hydrolase FrmB
MRYRIVLPSPTATLDGFPVVYLLHGSGGNFHDWINDSLVENLARNKLILVMPEGDASYYVNAAGRPQDRYEDYIVQDVPANIETNFPSVRGTAKRAIVGVSMGGFGAVKIALTHPGLYKFAGAMSPPLDAPRRAFSIRRVQQWWAFRSLFGSWDAETRSRSDPFLLVRSAEPSKAPYLFLSCGDQESLLPVNRQFAAVLDQDHLEHEFDVAAGGHDWKQWNTVLPILFEKLSQRMRD